MLAPFRPEWRNWHTQGPQKAPAQSGRVGSNPTSGTSGGSNTRLGAASNASIPTAAG